MEFTQSTSTLNSYGVEVYAKPIVDGWTEPNTTTDIERSKMCPNRNESNKSIVIQRWGNMYKRTQGQGKSSTKQKEV